MIINTVIKGSGGGSTVQPDYAQNDSTKPDYIKNRPFYAETTQETLLDQTFSTTTEDGLNFWATNTSVIQLTKGDTVKVVYNGTEYMQEVKELNSVLYFGNIGLVGLTPVTDEPFAVANIYYPDGLSKLTPGITVATSETQTDANIKIYKSVQDVHTIEPKYIKDMYYAETNAWSGSLTVTEVKSSGGIEASATISDFAWSGTVGDFATLTVGDNPFSVQLGALENGSYIFASSTLTNVCTYDASSSTLTVIVRSGSYTCSVGDIISVSISGETIVKIDSKYMPAGVGFDLKITLNANTNLGSLAAICNEALTAHLKQNSGDRTAIGKAKTLLINISSGPSYRFTRNALASPFFCIDSRAKDDGNFGDYYTVPRSSYFTTLWVQDDGTCTAFSGALLETSNWAFGIVQNKNSGGDLYSDDDNYVGKMAIAEKDYNLFSNPSGLMFWGVISLSDWITEAQKRTDFAIPTPSKATDLVDKQYVDGLVGSSVNAFNVSSFTITSSDITDTTSTVNDTTFYALTDDCKTRLLSWFNAIDFMKIISATSIRCITSTAGYGTNLPVRMINQGSIQTIETVNDSASHLINVNAGTIQGELVLLIKAQANAVFSLKVISEV